MSVDAIRQYRDIVAKYPANRAVAAEALLRMGRCCEEMGTARSKEAQKACERVVREYADQKEAAAEEVQTRNSFIPLFNYDYETSASV